MTNAEKYLKENVYIEDILSDFGNMYADNELQKAVLILGLKNFFEAPAKEEQAMPKLTEDEKVILRNIDETKRPFIIFRSDLGHLGIKNEELIFVYSLFGFNHLFQFIKDGEEFSIKELLQ